jgi:hypothetical protein
LGSGRRVLIALAVVLLFAVPAFSQSCALCYTQAAASGGKLIAALRSGIVVLIVPPMFMSVGITWLAYQKRNLFGSDNFGPDSEEEIEFHEDRDQIDE